MWQRVLSYSGGTDYFVIELGIESVSPEAIVDGSIKESVRLEARDLAAFERYRRILETERAEYDATTKNLRIQPIK